MPELPEVETIARRLDQGAPDSPAAAGRKILRAHLLWARTLAAPSPEIFQARLPGQVIQKVSRRGKFLLLGLSRDTLVIHLRMSGDMHVRPQEVPPAPHDRLLLELSGGLYLAFNDTRKFGRAWLVREPAEVCYKLGPEPLDPNFSPDLLYQKLKACKRQIKPLLLDQSFLAGIGNIYSDEALHLARIHPRSLSHHLTPAQVERLWQSIRHVLKEGIRLQGASIDWVYRGGDFQNHFRAYRRTGLPCPACGAPIKRAVIGQRSTHFCPNCQPEPDAS